MIGAGLAGLAAADELKRTGRETIVLEARDRVGGRVHSRTLENGAVVEMGAEFILPGCTRVHALAERFGLGLWDKGMRYGTREPRGVEVSAASLAEAAELIDAALAAGVDGLSARDVLGGLEIESGAREAILARVEVSAAAPAELVPAVELGGVARLSDEPAPSIAGGNGRLAEALAGAVEDSIHLRTPVHALSWGEDGVIARTDVDEVHGSACVLAVPATVIERIAFDPPLPEPLLRALRAIGYGHAAKLFVPLREPPEPHATLAVSDRYWAWTATGAEDRPQPVISAFAGSSPALERLEVESGPDIWLERLARLRPELELDPSGALLSTWDDDPWAGAAYSLDPGDDLRAAISAPLEPLAFAGEHLGSEFGGLMEGALRSGVDAADKLAA